MSIEIDCGVIHGSKGRQFRVFANVCAEFPTQVDFVRVLYGQAEIYQGRPSEAKTLFQKQVVAFARNCVSQLEWDDGIIEDF